MRPIFSRILKSYFAPELDLRVKLFNILAVGGMITSLIMAALSAYRHLGLINTISCLAIAVLSFGLLIYCKRRGRYQICYMITIFTIFMIMFPIIFFYTGGYYSGMPLFFVFAIVFTFFMLEGRRAIVFAILEMITYLSVIMIAYHYPQLVHHFSSEEDLLFDLIFSLVVVSLILGISMFLYFRIYKRQQQKLDKQNKLLYEANQAKIEFLANTSHEMRTPLTVVSVNVQTVLSILEEQKIKNLEVTELLAGAQSEVMRLSRMIGGMLTLTSISENAEWQQIDFTKLLKSGAQMLRLSIEKNGNTLDIKIEEELYVYGSGDLLAQVLSNLLNNAGAHTKNGRITLSAQKDKGEIIVIVEDNGSGITSEMLPHVFERGVSNGGTGFGLYLCKIVADSHGGRTWIESQVGVGTRVFFSIPYYEGQFGGSEKYD